MILNWKVDLLISHLILIGSHYRSETIRRESVINSKNLYADDFKADYGFKAENGSGLFSGTVESKYGSIDIEGYNSVYVNSNTSDRLSIKAAKAVVSGSANSADFSDVNVIDLSKGFTIKN